MGLDVGVAECWQKLDDPNIALKRLGTARAPLPAVELDALERLYPKIKNDDARFFVAANLYRYGRAAGRDYLLGRLKAGSTHAALVFALNRDEAVLPDILKRMEFGPEEEFVQALGGWRHAKIGPALLKHFRKWVKYGEHKEELLLPLAEQGVKDALPDIRKIYNAAAKSPGTDRQSAAAALILLGVPERERLLESLLAELRRPPEDPAVILKRRSAEAGHHQFTLGTPLSKVPLIRLIGRSGQSRAAAGLREVIRGFLKADPNRPDQVFDGNNYLEQFDAAVAAAEELARLRSRDSGVALSEFMLHFKPARVLTWKDAHKESARQETERGEAVWNEAPRVARALLDIDESLGRIAIEKTLGKAWLENEMASRKLKKLPSEWMPPIPWATFSRWVEAAN